MGKIIAYCREGCPHSINTASVLSNLKKNNVEIISVPDNQIAKNDVFNKLNHLINNHRTFPIVIYETSKGKQYFIGGNDVFMSLIRLSESYQLHRDKNNILKYILTSPSCNNLDDGQKRLLYYLIKNNS